MYRVQLVDTKSEAKLFYIFICIVSMQRIVRRWNQTGQKHAGEPDIAQTFLGGHRFLLWSCIASTYFATARKLWRRFPTGLGAYPALICILAFGYKMTFSAKDAPELSLVIDSALLTLMDRVNLVQQARVIFIGILAIPLLDWTLSPSDEGDMGRFGRLPRSTVPPPFVQDLRTVSDCRVVCLETVHDSLTLFLLMQTKAQNIPLFLIFEVLRHQLGMATPAM